ncbi:jg3835 [Pararge aegeria aegeria]|uniref:Jg3835 protein n=1 Tax=Pararge aegeria aegeria TaxID=348720 RepID=A0A8S4RXN8_9NEOP|nr:jg3835 [Pararge aegeria aegeria]
MLRKGVLIVFSVTLVYPQNGKVVEAFPGIEIGPPEKKAEAHWATTAIKFLNTVAFSIHFSQQSDTPTPWWSRRPLIVTTELVDLMRRRPKHVPDDPDDQITAENVPKIRPKVHQINVEPSRGQSSRWRHLRVDVLHFSPDVVEPRGSSHGELSRSPHSPSNAVATPQVAIGKCPSEKEKKIHYSFV